MTNSPVCGDIMTSLPLFYRSAKSVRLEKSHDRDHIINVKLARIMTHTHGGDWVLDVDRRTSGGPECRTRVERAAFGLPCALWSRRATRGIGVASYLNSRFRGPWPFGNVIIAGSAGCTANCQAFEMQLEKLLNSGNFYFKNWAWAK